MIVARVAIIVIAAALGGCASAPQRAPGKADLVPPPSGAELAAQHANRLVGRPYRFGGAHPSRGFDCSGLVQFSFKQAGHAVPRSTEAQRQASRPVRPSELRRGDLLFFDQEGRDSSHVGIYLGDGAFVHAPSSGKRVRRDRLDTPYWRKHLSEVRRLEL
jgi:murein DD-endopeptidase